MGLMAVAVVLVDILALQALIFRLGPQQLRLALVGLVVAQPFVRVCLVISHS